MQILRTMAVSGLLTATLGACLSEHDDTQTMAMSRHEYQVKLTGAHAHILKQVSPSFAVMLLDDCMGMADQMDCPMPSGLPVKVFYRHTKESTMTEQELAAGVLEDSGDGNYVWHHAFDKVGAYVIGFQWEEDDQTYSFAFPFETSRAGGERYFCNTTPAQDATNDFSYQIRWDNSVGKVLADNAEITFSVEVMRSFNTPVNETEPWTNKFNHLRPSELVNGSPTIELMAGEGTSVESLGNLIPTYAGKGMYQVKRAFTTADLGGLKERTFWLKITMVDDQGCTVDGGTDPAEYYFGVSAPN
ncbi:MAG: hypothetical protein A2289_21455 [Deltaproteobacteria bacterium RIFOXYA12_FULL_58_15]|nr:MAG: hypothetical protein A2289_21455 [Deltaproteobacteria bacterium RIFOXYA12_FULL_58_15]OGR11890.1 MAG: hypothetical protein A2341_17125 [Deltaproteobacteria bacterium RIFOXYB12_FULL_58_9]